MATPNIHVAQPRIAKPTIVPHRAPCNFAQVNREISVGNRSELERLNINVSQHIQTINTQSYQIYQLIGCLEGKIKTNQSLLFELIRKFYGDRYATSLQQNINPNLDGSKLDELRRQEKVLDQQEINLKKKFWIKIIKLGIIVVSITMVVLGSYLVSLQI